MSARALLFIDQAIVSVLLVGLLILAFQLRREWKAAWTGKELLLLSIISLGALAFRLLWIKPALIHGDWQGALLVQSVLDFPAPGGLHEGSYGKNYGQGSFITLGLLSLIFGKTPQGVLGSNVLISALSTFPLAFVAKRWSGSSQAGLLSALVWASSGLVGRLAHSEDAHIVGVFYGLCALALAEIASDNERFHSAWAASLMAAILASWSRETCYVFVPLVILMVAERAFRQSASPRLNWRIWQWGSALALLMVLYRVQLSYRKTGMYRDLLRGFSEDPVIILGLFRHHPLLTLGKLGPLVTLFGLLGCALLIRRSPVRLSLSFGLGAWLILTLPAALAYVGMSWSFRLPLYTLVIIGTGAGLWESYRWLGHRTQLFSRPLGQGLALSLLAILCAMGTAPSVNRSLSAEFVEYTYLYALASQLPKSSVLISGNYEHRYITKAVAQGQGLRSVSLAELPAAPDSEHWYLAAGQAAYSYTWFELLPESAFAGSQGKEHATPWGESLYPYLVSLFDIGQDFGRLHFSVPPSGMRQDFAALVARSELYQSGPRLKLRDQDPHAIFSQDEADFALYRWVE